jgi:DNA ligase-1
VEYAALVEVYERLAGTQSTHEKTAIVAETLAETAHEDLPMTAQLLRGTLFAPWNPAELGVSSSLATRAIERATGVPAEEVEADWRETGDLGSAAARAVERAVQQTLVSETLTVEGVYADLRELAGYEGTGSEDRRVDTVAGLLADADPDEAQYVVRTALGHLRLGVGRGTVRDAIAAAFLGGDPDEPGETPEADVQAVERALQVTNDPGLVAQTAADAGRPGLADLDLEVGRPVEVMLAEKADSVEAAVADTLETSSATDGADSGDADPTAPPAPLSEYKVDGFRAQVHFAAGEHGDGATGPRIFTRRLEDVTAQFPDVVDAMDGFDADSYIVEGEIVAYDPDTGEPVPFQQLSRRIKRKHDVERLVEAVPVVLYLFDLLSLDGASLLDRSLVERVDALEGRLTERERGLERMPNLRSREPDRVREFYEAALAAGHEGLMVKTADAAYQPGKRVGYTRKVKPTMESLDLVVTRAKWSEGRRSNNLGRLYLACRDGDRFREVGRLSTGFTDDQLAELTARLEPHVLEEDGRAVDLEPTEVLEVAYEEVQESPKYDSGYALRFPRFEGFRDDLDVGDADTVERVESLYEGQ